jgi:hypothetical protein
MGVAATRAIAALGLGEIALALASWPAIAEPRAATESGSVSLSRAASSFWANDTEDLLTAAGMADETT